MAFDRDDLRERVLDNAEARIAAEGAETLRARTLAVDAGVSVGTIYNLFGSMDGALDALFVRLLTRFEGEARQAVRTAASASERLMALADAYLDFVVRHEAAWTALLAHNARRDAPPGDEATALQGPAFDLVGDVLADAMPEPDARRRLARMLWSSVHGIVQLNYLGIGTDEALGATRAMVARLVELTLAGLVANGRPASR